MRVKITDVFAKISLATVKMQVAKYSPQKIEKGLVKIGLAKEKTELAKLFYFWRRRRADRARKQLYAIGINITNITWIDISRKVLKTFPDTHMHTAGSIYDAQVIQTSLPIVYINFVSMNAAWVVGAATMA